jgi:hypothetical protein
LELVLVEARHRFWREVSKSLSIKPAHRLRVQIPHLLGVEPTKGACVKCLEVARLELIELVGIDLPDGLRPARWWARANRTALSAWGRVLSAWGRVLSAWGRVLSAWGRVLSAWGRVLSAWGWVLSAWGWVLSAWGWVLSAWGFVHRLRRLRRKWRGSWRDRERKEQQCCAQCGNKHLRSDSPIRRRKRHFPSLDLQQAQTLFPRGYSNPVVSGLQANSDEPARKASGPGVSPEAAGT